MRKTLPILTALIFLNAVQILAVTAPRPNQIRAKTKAEMQMLKDRDIALSRLQSQCISKVDVQFNDKGIPHLLNGKLSLSAHGEKSDFALRFIETYKELFMLNAPITELKIRSQKEDRAGNTHIRFEQTYQSLPVWGAQILVHFHSEGYIKSINGNWEPEPNLDVTPSLSREKAIEISTDDLRVQNVPLRGPESKLLIFPWGDSVYLAWQVTMKPDLVHNWIYFVDAKSGSILLKYNDVKNDGPIIAQGIDLNNNIVPLNAYVYSGFVFLIDASKPMYMPPIDSGKGIIICYDLTTDTNFVDSIPVFDPNGDSLFNDNEGLKSAVSAHFNLGVIYDYFYQTFGRNSWDGKGGTISALLHPPMSFDPNNAVWDGSVIVFGDGDGVEFSPLAGALDITAHEFGHAITQTTANLIYLGEWGALNEHFSDVWGAMLDRDDWFIGEDIYLPGTALRDMADPHNLGSPGEWQPAHMSEYVYYPWSDSMDNGGVHMNSGIPNKACYLMASAIGRDTTEQLYYQALTNYLFPKSRFVDLRWSLLLSAEDLYILQPNYLHIRSSIMNAFDAVGITDLYATGDTVLAYDDGIARYMHYSDSSMRYAVRFSPHAPCTLLAIAAQFNTAGTNSYLHIWSDWGGVPGTEELYANIDRTIVYPDWGILDLSSFNLKFDQDFYVGFSSISLDSFLLSDSLIDPNYYTSYYDSGTGWFCVNPPGDPLTISGNLLIRAIIKYDSVYPTDAEEPAVALLPANFGLGQNYPNPFNPLTRIEYSIPEKSRVIISIYNLLGQKIYTLVDETKPAGIYHALWDGRDYEGRTAASAIYLYQIKAGSFISTKKMILLR